MTQLNQPSRRDWFRLRKPVQNQTLGAPATTAQEDNAAHSATMKSIEHPPNHDGMNLAELPPLREAILSIEQIENLFHDVEHLATEVLLMQRTAGSQRASGTSVKTPDQLRIAKTALLAGQIPRLQIRYRWENSMWIDTLAVQADGGYRLVRIAHQS